MSEIVNKPWGSYEVLHQTDKSLTKILTINPGCSTSRQKHMHRSEHYVIVDGHITLICDEIELTLDEDDYISIDVGEVHMIYNHTNTVARIIETWYSKEGILSEDDIERMGMVNYD